MARAALDGIERIARGTLELDSSKVAIDFHETHGHYSASGNAPENSHAVPNSFRGQDPIARILKGSLLCYTWNRLEPKVPNHVQGHK